MDANEAYRLYRAFHLGARAMLSLDGKQITNDQLKRLRELLTTIADGESILQDPGTEAMQNPMIAEFIASQSSVPIKNDRETAKNILVYRK